MPTKQGRKTSYGEGHFLLRALLNRPQSREEITQTYRRLGNFLDVGAPAPKTKKYQKWQNKVDTDLARLIKLELVAKGADLDISRFARIEERIVENHRNNYLKGWILFSLQETNRREEINAKCVDSFSGEGLPFVDQFGFLIGYDFTKNLDSSFKGLINKGLVANKADGHYLTRDREKALRKIPVSERYA